MPKGEGYKEPAWLRSIRHSLAGLAGQPKVPRGLFLILLETFKD